MCMLKGGQFDYNGVRAFEVLLSVYLERNKKNEISKKHKKGVLSNNFLYNLIFCQILMSFKFS